MESVGFVAGGCGVGLSRRSGAAAVSRRGRMMMSTKPLKVNTDIKGNAVWTLREAKESDAKQILDIGVVGLTYELIEALISTGDKSALVASATLKNSGDNESSAAALARPDENNGDAKAASTNSVVVGAVLANVIRTAADPSKGKDSAIDKVGDLVLIKVDDRMPEKDDVEKKLLVGALKKLKTAQVSEVYCTLKKGSPIEELLTSSGFSKKSEQEDEETLVANLVSMNPDPQKKIM